MDNAIVSFSLDQEEDLVNFDISIEGANTLIELYKNFGSKNEDRLKFIFCRIREDDEIECNATDGYKAGKVVIPIEVNFTKVKVFKLVAPRIKFKESAYGFVNIKVTNKRVTWDYGDTLGLQYDNTLAMPGIWDLIDTENKCKGYNWVKVNPKLLEKAIEFFRRAEGRDSIELGVSSNSTEAIAIRRTSQEALVLPLR